MQLLPELQKTNAHADADDEDETSEEGKRGGRWQGEGDGKDGKEQSWELTYKSVCSCPFHLATHHSAILGHTQRDEGFLH